MRHSGPGLPLLLVAIIALTLIGCQRGLSRLDRDVLALIDETSRQMNTGAPQEVRHPEDDPASASDVGSETLSTFNPPADAMEFTPDTDKADIAARLGTYEGNPEGAQRMDLPAALAYAFANSRDYRFEEEEYVLSAIRLLIERHRWGPIFADEISVDVDASGDDGTFDSALRIVNELSVTQRLPWGGDVSIRALARATEDLHQLVAGEETQSADLIMSMSVPLLRGAGFAARESRIQAERDLIYAARDFEDFRRQFALDITEEFLALVVSLQRIGNSEDQVENLQFIVERETNMFQAGRITPYELGLAEQRLVSGQDSLDSARENFKLALDRFKLRIGMSIDEPLVIAPSGPGLPTPKTTPEDAATAAMANRLDLQTQRDRLDDSKRDLLIAENDLLPDLDLSGSISLPTDPDKARSGLDFKPGDGEASIGITFGLPLDREIERLALRQAQISLDRAIRSYREFRDNIAVEVRSAVRDIDRALFAKEIQARGVEIAQTRLDSIRAAPERVEVREQSEAVDDLSQAQNDYDSSVRDLQLAVMQHLLVTGQLRVNDDGSIEPLRGMELIQSENPAEAGGG